MHAKAAPNWALHSSLSSTDLCDHPKLGAPWKNRRRHLRLRKFPFSIIYYTRGAELRVVALAHHRQKPGYWAGRR